MTTRTASSPRIGRIATLEQLAHAYPELVRRVRRYLLARCDVDHAAAEDAAHDAIEEIARRALRGETVEHPVTFACARARNALRNEQRAAARLDRLKQHGHRLPRQLGLLERHEHAGGELLQLGRTLERRRVVEHRQERRDDLLVHDL